MYILHSYSNVTPAPLFSKQDVAIMVQNDSLALTPRTDILCPYFAIVKKDTPGRKSVGSDSNSFRTVQKCGINVPHSGQRMSSGHAHQRKRCNFLFTERVAENVVAFCTTLLVEILK